MESQTNRNSISTKIFWVAASFSLPIAVLVYLVVANIASQLDFRRKEITGNAYLRPLMNLLVQVQNHQLAAGNPAAGRPASEAAVDHWLQELAKAQRASGNDLQFTEAGLRLRHREHQNPATLEQEWRGLVAAAPSLNPSDAGARHEHLLADIRTMITHAGDTSNLILDPDLDSYYLMDVTLLALPETLSRLPKTAQGAESMLHEHTSKSMALAAADFALLKEYMDRVQASMETAVNEDVNFYGASPTFARAIAAPLAKFKDAQKTYLDLVNQAVAGDAKLSAGDFMKTEESTRQAAFAFWTVAVDELDALLAIRVAYYSTYRIWALVSAGAALFAASLLAWFLARSIVRPLDSLLRSLGPGATLLTASVERIAETSRGEAAASPMEAQIICEELNGHADDMRKAVLELALHVQGSGAEQGVLAAAGYREELQ